MMAPFHGNPADENPKPVSATPQTKFRIADIVLDQDSVLRRNANVERERAVAIHDLLADNYFEPVGSDGGPYHLHLGIVENRLTFTIYLEAEHLKAAHLQHGQAHGRIALSLTPFRRVVREYFAICESYYSAIGETPHSRIEALDMGRRGLHNEGAELLTERLKGKADLDFETARRLFTLISVLHLKL